MTKTKTDIKCSRLSCPNPATDEALYVMKQAHNSMPIESPVIVYACPTHAVDIEWSTLYREGDWVSLQKTYEDQGFLPPLIKFSHLEIRPITAKDDGK